MKGGGKSKIIEEPVDSEEVSEEYSGDPENFDVEAIVNPKAPVASAEDFKTTQRKPVDHMTMDLDVQNLNKNYKNIWRTIY